jgi:hypothetical protein
VPKKSKPAKQRPLYKTKPSKPGGGRPQGPRPLYKSPPPKPERGSVTRSNSQNRKANSGSQSRAPEDFVHATPIVPAHFELREDGSISPVGRDSVEPKSKSESQGSRDFRPTNPPSLTFSNSARQLWLYHGNCLELLDAIADKYPDGRFDAIFADPPYFLSNGGITCHAGKMVKVDKGEWDKSRGPELNHEFNLEWLRRCQRVLKPNGTIWVATRHHHRAYLGNRAEIK